MKKILLFLIPSLSLAANPKSIHWSALYNGLVDQDGNRTTITGHPKMTCYIKSDEITGTYLSAEGYSIWLLVSFSHNEFIDIKIKYPVCDLR